MYLVEELCQTGEKIPFTEERFQQTYSCAGGALAPYFRVYSVGKTPEAAIKKLGKKVRWGKLKNFERQDDIQSFAWYYRFTANDTSMKASGYFVPGGCILSWWK